MKLLSIILLSACAGCAASNPTVNPHLTVAPPPLPVPMMLTRPIPPAQAVQQPKVTTLVVEATFPALPVFTGPQANTARFLWESDRDTFNALFDVQPSNMVFESSTDFVVWSPLASMAVLDSGAGSTVRATNVSTLPAQFVRAGWIYDQAQ